MKRLSSILKMMLLIIFSTLTVFFLGCSSSYPVRSTPVDGGYTYSELNNKLKGEDASIVFKGEKNVSAKEIKIAGDSVSWLDVRTGKASKVSIRQVDKIVTKNHFLGGMEGLGFGVVGGGGIGAAVLAAADTHEGELGGHGAEIGLVLGGGLGTIFGLTFGLAAGHSYNYEFPIVERIDSTAKAPVEKPAVKALTEDPAVKTDVIHLKNGSTIRGTIISESRDGSHLIRVTIRNLHGEDHTYTSSEIERIESRNE